MSKLDELIQEGEAEAVICMERDGMSPEEAGDMARATVNARRKQAAEDRKVNETSSPMKL